MTHTPPTRQHRQYSRNCRNSLLTLAAALLLFLGLALPTSAKLALLTTPVHTASSAASSSATAPFISIPDPLGTEFTIRTVTSISGASLFINNGDTIWLAGAGLQAGALPTAIALAWVPKESWWGFSTWTLQLQSEADLLPVDLVRAKGAAPTATAVDLLQQNPRPDHLYESLLSYDGVHGVISLRFTDLTENIVLYQGTFPTQRRAGPFFAAAGIKFRSEANSQVAVESLEVYPLYLPVGLSWNVGTRTTDQNFLPLSHFERNEKVNVAIDALGPSLPGTIQLLSVTAQGTAELARLQPSAPEINVELAAADLPIGKSSILIEYSENGVALLRDVTEITVGIATLNFANVVVDREHNQLTCNVTVSSAGGINDTNLVIRTRVDELLWNSDERTYEIRQGETMVPVEAALDIEPGSTAIIPIKLSLPGRPGYWNITFEPSTRPVIGIETTNTEQRFSTYLPAILEPGEPFVIAVLPDTQYMVESYPEIYFRQLQWIAEQADSQNIVLTLHLGDITDNNIPVQWETAVKGMQILDGVMPYILAQGNHDLTQAGGSVYDRDHSLINDYFPLSKQPWIAGTFEEGRIENSYSLFTFHGVKYLILSLEFGPRDEVLAWANRVVAEHPDYKVIMITHNYTDTSGGRSNSAWHYDIAKNPATTVNAGPEIWEKLVQHHENFLLVLSGHHHSEAIPRQAAIGENGNRVYEILVDYQSDPNGGNGYLVLMTFYPEGRIEVRAYSPYLGQDRDVTDRFGFNNHFIINTEKGTFEEVTKSRSIVRP